MKKRVITAVVLLPLLLAIVLLLPKIVTAILFGAMSAIGAYELLKGTGLVKQTRLVAYAMVMAFFVPLWSSMQMAYPLALLGVFVFFCVLFAELLLFHDEVNFEAIAVAFAAGIVLPFCLSSLVRLHSWPSGRMYILLPFVVAFMSDTGAYFTGLAFGKHKLAPVISPKKTVEGMFGGMLGAVLGVVIYCFVLKWLYAFEIRYVFIPVYGILGSAAAVFGDLCFSAVKRQTGIKDYGNLIPGHGGILDRFDSMIVVAPLVELLMIFVPLVMK